MGEKITSQGNSLIKEVVKLSTQKRKRDDEGLFIIEGIKMLEEAMEEGYSIENFFYTEVSSDRHKNAVMRLEDYSSRSNEVSYEVFKKISSTKSPQGMLGVLKKKEEISLRDMISKKKNIIVLENLQDPGNIGTIIRTADALNIDGVVLKGDCADIYSPKVIRSTMGSIFRTDIGYAENNEQFFNNLKEEKFTSYAACLSDKSEKLSKLKFAEKNVVFIGNEGSGLEKSTIDSCDIHLKIDMKGNAESLNAAVASCIIMWELSKNI